MASVLDTLVSDIKAAETVVVGKAENLFSWVTTEAATISAEVYSDIKAFLAAVAPGTMSNFNTALEGVAADLGMLVIDYVTQKSPDAILADILNKAEQLGMSELKVLSGPTLSLLLSLKAHALQFAQDASAEVKSLL